MHLLFALLAALYSGSASAPASAEPSTAKMFASAATVDVTAHPLTPQDAPADEYFGQLKLSNIGIRNIIHAIAVEGNSPLALPLQRTRIMGVDTAIVEWGDEYPRDTWLRHVVLNFADVLVPKHDVDTDIIAVDLLLQVSHRLRNTPYETVALKKANAIQPASAIDWTIVPYEMPTYADAFKLRGGAIR